MKINQITLKNLDMNQYSKMTDKELAELYHNLLYVTKAPVPLKLVQEVEKRKLVDYKPMSEEEYQLAVNRI